MVQKLVNAGQILKPTFGEGFLNQHAGRVINDVHYATVELVANAWDAGAEHVRITWPSAEGAEVSFADDGSGMTAAEFAQRWLQLSYNRLKDQGQFATFPRGKTRANRRAFGRNGLGRHAMFYFAEEYVVETTKDGVTSTFRVTRSAGETPLQVEPLRADVASSSGTTLRAITDKTLITEDELRDLIGSRFVVDPEFSIWVNDRLVRLTDLDHLSYIARLNVEAVGDLVLRRFDSQMAGRTSKQSGVAWWVHRRQVGSPSWDVFDGPLVDARTNVGKRFVYVVEADCLASVVKPDWSGFYSSAKTNLARRAASEFIRDDLRSLTSDFRRDRKLQALRANRQALEKLPIVSRENVAKFAEEIQVRSPTITPRDLENAVEVLAQLEQARSGFGLLEKLAKLAAHDLDALDGILAEWSIQDARRVLDELRFRLDLISQLERLVESHNTDELHDLQPLFERGLWMFGPNFESITFSSNRTLATVVKEFLGDRVLKDERLRPDFVALPDASIGAYSTDSYDDENEVDGIERVVLVELKRGGYTISVKEKDQALGYARALRTAGRIGRDTPITAYVLGTVIDSFAEDTSSEGETKIIPLRYADLLRRAHARTFNLLAHMERSRFCGLIDSELSEALDPAQLEMSLSNTDDAA
ncbi:MAG TPA: ATP-binding protein [Candidatus Binatia bacterium]|nr:ATP-binding protein [Candidatus Binatia bacterium]